MKATKRTVAIDPVFNKVVRDGLNAALLVSSLGFSVGIVAESQVISISSNNTNYFPGESFKASILYETTNIVEIHVDQSSGCIPAIVGIQGGTGDGIAPDGYDAGEFDMEFAVYYSNLQ